MPGHYAGGSRDKCYFEVTGEQFDTSDCGNVEAGCNTYFGLKFANYQSAEGADGPRPDASNLAEIVCHGLRPTTKIERNTVDPIRDAAGCAMAHVCKMTVVYRPQ